MKKILLLCTLAMTFLLGACGGASDNIEKAFSLVVQKGDADKVYEYISASSYDYDTMSLEDMVKLNMCVQYVNTSSWGHADEQIKERQKVIGEILTELSNRQRTFTPEQQKQYLEYLTDFSNKR